MASVRDAQPPNAYNLQVERKKTYTLAHDAGAGAQCKKCSSCSGFELHFWRKVCQNCRCSKIDHEVRDEGRQEMERISRRLTQLLDLNENINTPPPSNKPAGASILKQPSPLYTPTAPLNKYMTNNSQNHNNIPSENLQNIANNNIQPNTNENVPNNSNIQNTNFPSHNLKTPSSGVNLMPKLQSMHKFNLGPRPFVRPKVESSLLNSLTDKNGLGERANRAVDLPMSVPIYTVMPPEQQHTTQPFITPSLPAAPTQTKQVSFSLPQPLDFSPQESERIDLTPRENNERQQRFDHQIPPHDVDPDMCNSLTKNELDRMNEYVDSVKKNVVGQGRVQEQIAQPAAWVCAGCDKPLLPGEVAVQAERAGSDRVWHPTCFTCCVCQEVLQDLIYFHTQGKVYCGRHYAETVLPRCAACDELIFAKEYTVAEGKSWHVPHFCCWQCDQPLVNQRYVPRDSNPYCITCYDQQFGKVCDKCQQKIAADVARVNHDGRYWHATPECFHCSSCHNSLLDKLFVATSEHIFCNVECKKRLPVTDL